LSGGRTCSLHLDYEPWDWLAFLLLRLFGNHQIGSRSLREDVWLWFTGEQLRILHLACENKIMVQIGMNKIAEFGHKRPFRQRILFVQAPSMTNPKRHALQRTDRPDWAFLQFDPHGFPQ
jgi:hypothetical protein